MKITDTEIYINTVLVTTQPSGFVVTVLRGPAGGFKGFALENPIKIPNENIR